MLIETVTLSLTKGGGVSGIASSVELLGGLGS